MYSFQKSLLTFFDEAMATVDYCCMFVCLVHDSMQSCCTTARDFFGIVRLLVIKQQCSSDVADIKGRLNQVAVI